MRLGADVVSTIEMTLVINHLPINLKGQVLCSVMLRVLLAGTTQYLVADQTRSYFFAHRLDCDLVLVSSLLFLHDNVRIPRKPRHKALLR